MLWLFHQVQKGSRSWGPYFVEPLMEVLSYETVAAFGSMCGNSDLKVIAKANQLCNAYGLDNHFCWQHDCVCHGVF